MQTAIDTLDVIHCREHIEAKQLRYTNKILWLKTNSILLNVEINAIGV